jgi:hypothetical protein
MKIGPCGAGPHTRTDIVTVFEPGETITVEWNEIINHTSTFRIAFDDDGDDAFQDPADTTDFYTNDAVLLDEIPDEPDRQYAVQVTLPDIECENCTLQLHQWMQDKPPYTPGGDDIYYQCADLALRSTAPEPEPEPEEPADDSDDGGGGGCSTSGLAPSGALLGTSLLLRRRSPRR